ncbi:ATP-binding protein [Microbulbifer epialgicus]|uniref:ATP-binding protein n=1 Tax=Microbulbifer epialgicus TaxID=393907 RepID=A0ABV4NTC1_9GAMM
MKKWLRAVGWKRSTTSSPTAQKLDVLGESLDLLTSFGEKLNIESVQLLIAIGVLSSEDSWVSIKSLKEKSPIAANHRISRSLKQLQGDFGLFSGVTKNAPLIKMRPSLASSREKEVKLTDFGKLILHRVLQLLHPASARHPDGYDNSIVPCYIPLLEGTIDNKEIQPMAAPRLLLTGSAGYGKSTVALALAADAIRNGAVVFFIDTFRSLESAQTLRIAADGSYRAHAFFVNNLDQTDKTPVEEVFWRQGVCVHHLVPHLHGMEKAPGILKEQLGLLIAQIAKAARTSQNSVHVVIDGLGSLSVLSGCNKHIGELIELGASVHISEQNSSASDYETFFDLDFAQAIFRVEDNDLYAKQSKLDPRVFAEVPEGQIVWRSSGGEYNGPIQLHITI